MGLRFHLSNYTIYNGKRNLLRKRDKERERKRECEIRTRYNLLNIHHGFKALGMEIALRWGIVCRSSFTLWVGLFWARLNWVELCLAKLS